MDEPHATSAGAAPTASGSGSGKNDVATSGSGGSAKNDAGPATSGHGGPVSDAGSANNPPSSIDAGSANNPPSSIDAAASGEPPIRDAAASGEPPIDLRSAAQFVILAKSGISTVPPSVITGDIGVSPAAATSITGFSLTPGATKAFSGAAQVTGKVFAADYAAPTPATLTAAISDAERAYVDAAGREPKTTELGAGSIGGMTLDAGIYNWSSALTIADDVKLSGTATDLWILQVAGDLTLASATRVRLDGGALPKNVFWQVGGKVVLESTAHLEGVVLTKTAVTLATGASITGRLLAQTAVTLDGNTVVAPAP